MARKTSSGDGVGMYKFRDLLLWGTAVNHDVLHACPFIAELDICMDLSKFDFTALRSLKYLKSVYFQNDFFVERYDFLRSILPYLTEKGSQLEKLTLCGIIKVDLLAVGYHCKNLKTLYVQGTNLQEEPERQVSFPSRNERQNMFKSLVKLELLYEEEGPFSEHMHTLPLVLSSCTNLQILKLSYMFGLETHHLLEVYQNNPLVKLETVRIQNCGGVTAEAIAPLLQDENELKKLEVLDCRNISRQDFESMQRVTRKSCFDIDIGWS